MTCEIPTLNHHRYDPVGHCIYCGTTNGLSDEHIVPYGLSGNLVLPASSCHGCAQITSQIERAVLRGPLWAVRIYREMQSRRRHRRAPRTYPLRIKRNGDEMEITLPAHEYPILLDFLKFSPPRYLDPDGQEDGLRISGVITISFGPRPEDVLARLNATKLIRTQSHDPGSFARMIAKIAHAMAAAGRVLSLIDGPSRVLPAIRGEKDDIGNWVGTLDGPIQQPSEHHHRVQIHRDARRGLLFGEVHLFSDSQAPRYGVILGPLKRSSAHP